MTEKTAARLQAARLELAERELVSASASLASAAQALEATGKHGPALRARSAKRATDALLARLGPALLRAALVLEAAR